MKILVVDIETTGFSYSDAIVEIGIALVDTRTKEIELIFDEVVRDVKFNPAIHSNAWIFKNTNLTVGQVEIAKSLEHYKKTLQEMFDKHPMTAFNKSFDIRFLKASGFNLNDIKCIMKSASQYSNHKNKNG